MKRPLNLQSQDSDLILHKGAFHYIVLSSQSSHRPINSGITSLVTSLGTVNRDLSVFGLLFVLHSSYCLTTSDLLWTVICKKQALCNVNNTYDLLNTYCVPDTVS